jgi:ATP-binding cassette, subfamily B, heavy metal transporter
MRALMRIAPYLWPKGEAELRLRVVAALVLVATAKAANVLVPIAYARAVDALAPQSGIGAAVTVPVALLLGYGMLRVMSSLFAELRNAIFAKVQARAGRRVALEVFEHLHPCPCASTWTAQTGGLSRVIERGVRGIATSLNFLLFNIIPTIVEILFVADPVVDVRAVLHADDAWHHRRLCRLHAAVHQLAPALPPQMNETDQEANTKAVDSLLNYETVKYFGNEGHEARRYDDSLTRYERAYVRSETTLNMLNAGQAASSWRWG